MYEAFCSDCKRQTEVVFDHSGGDTSGDNDPVRVGGPTNPLLTDGGLSTFIAKPNGGSGEFFSSFLGRWQSRGSNPDRALILAFKTIATMSDRRLRNWLIALADAGFRAISFDYRGYGLSDVPPTKATFLDVLNDLLSVIDSLGLPKVFLVGKDFGARPAHFFSILYPERVLGVIGLGVPYVPPGPSMFHKLFPEGFYILRWKEPGRPEADFGRFDVKTVVRNIYILFSRSKIPIANENQEIMDLVEPDTPLPSWFTEEDLATYGALYEKSGFQPALQIPYRSFDEVFNLPREVSEVIAKRGTVCDFWQLFKALISSKARDRANEIYKRVEDQKSSRGRNQDVLLAACLYIACRQQDKPCTVKGIAYDSFNIWMLHNLSFSM
ncbi:hypothetical protein Fmac_001411 [Flemingia macrophylla]|uniref:AB hydrolase-1 domain-containing protein n=1 Tax=Flemingia macrophylla TaxID=520843 RepID=A0ABD1NH09_9FABA